MEQATNSGTAPGGESERRRARGWLVAGLAAAVVALAVFALQQAGGGGGGPLNAVARAAEVTQREAGGHALLRATLTVANSSQGLTETGSMVFDNSDRARGTLVLQGHTTGRRLKLQVIADGTTTYTSSDQLDALSEGRKWVKIDFASASATASAPAAAAGPSEGLKLLEQMDGAEELGKKEIRGVATTGYRGTLPVSVKEVFGVELQLSPPRVEAWIDARDRVRRMRVVASGSIAGRERSTTTETIDFFDFGPVPKIEVPKPDEVHDATGLVESQVRSSAEAP